MASPTEDWRQIQIHSTNPLERLNREIRRRSDVVDFPIRESAIRLLGAILMENKMNGLFHAVTLA